MSKQRGNGTGTVCKRKDSKSRPWVAIAPAIYTDEGKPKRIVIGHFKTSKEAKEALFQYQQNPTEKFNIIFSDVFAEWSEIAYRSISKQTIDNYNAAYKKLSALYRLRFRDIRTSQMQKIIDENSSMSQSSLSKIKILLVQLYTYAIKNDIINKNYAEFIVLPKKETKGKDSFTELEVTKIAKAIDTVPFADVILCMCYTGFRINEFLKLSSFSYSQENGTLTGGSKTSAGKNRIVPIHPKIHSIVEKWLSKKGQTIFCKEDGSPYSARLFREKHYYPALEKIGVRRLSPHCTRHTCATMLSSAGAPPEDIQKILGHAKFDTTANTYIHQELVTLQKAINLLK